MKKFLKHKLVLILLIPIAVYLTFCFLLYWIELPPIMPPGWVKYSSLTNHQFYSFYYPSEWVLTECGDGEVVVAKTKVDKCLLPLEAPQSYLDNVYFQSFLPNHKYSVISNQEASPSASLKGWKHYFVGYGDDLTPMFNKYTPFKLSPYRNMAGNAFPVRYDSKYDVIDDTGKRTPNYLDNLYIGFYPHPAVQAEQNKVFASIRYDYR